MPPPAVILAVVAVVALAFVVLGFAFSQSRP